MAYPGLKDVPLTCRYMAPFPVDPAAKTDDMWMSRPVHQYRLHPGVADEGHIIIDVNGFLEIELHAGYGMDATAARELAHWILDNLPEKSRGASGEIVWGEKHKDCGHE